MIIVATLMVRDEVDVVAAMVEHHLAQGLDALVVTDNGSVDGTAEVLQAYADQGLLELHHDPTHRKQQGEVVTRMARRARTHFRADWVLNLDADEFWVARDRSLTVREALERTPLHLNSFTVPVTNLVGAASARGSWLDRLVHRDLRTDEELRTVGIHAHPTSDSVHRGESDVVVSQGNHSVSLVSNGQPDPEVELEVLHVPWRSWAQVERKVVQAGLAYTANPDLRPSPNHHGMADYRRHDAGRLENLYALRLPTQDVLDQGTSRGSFASETSVRDQVRSLVHEGRAHRPDLLAPLLQDADPELTPQEHQDLAELGARFVRLERERDAAARTAQDNLRLAKRLGNQRDAARRALEQTRADRRDLVRRLDEAKRSAPQALPLGREVRRLAARVVRGARRRAWHLRRAASERARAATGRRSRPRT